MGRVSSERVTKTTDLSRGFRASVFLFRKRWSPILVYGFFAGILTLGRAISPCQV